MEPKKIVHTELYYRPFGCSQSQKTPFYCEEEDKMRAESLLNTLVENKAKKLVEQRVEAEIKEALYRWFLKNK